jgi:hypothetical protein
MRFYITEAGAREFMRQNVELHDAIIANAKILAIKDGRAAIDEVHIKKAVKQVIFKRNSAVKWIIDISMLVLVGFAFYQIAIIRSSWQWNLLLLPIFSIGWIMIVTYILRDLLL